MQAKGTYDGTFCVWVSGNQRMTLRTHQGFADVDRLMEDCPHNCFIASGCGQGALVAVKLCEIHIPNQFPNRKRCLYGRFSFWKRNIKGESDGCNRAETEVVGCRAIDIIYVVCFARYRFISVVKLWGTGQKSLKEEKFILKKKKWSKKRCSYRGSSSGIKSPPKPSRDRGWPTCIPGLTPARYEAEFVLPINRTSKQETKPENRSGIHFLFGALNIYPRLYANVGAIISQLFLQALGLGTALHCETLEQELQLLSHSCLGKNNPPGTYLCYFMCRLRSCQRQN